MYEYTDTITKKLNVKLMKQFGRAKNILGFDQINALDDIYAKVDAYARKALLAIAKHYNEEADEDWLREKVLDAYDPLLKYVYSNEVERKRSYFFEALVATKFMSNLEADRALKRFVGMTNQLAIDTTDIAILEDYKKKGYTKMKWNTAHDERRCSECGELDGQIFDIEDVPVKPHYGCRCYLSPIKVEVKK